MLTHTGALALLSFIGANGAAPTDPTDFVHDARWGNAVGVKPTMARTGEGVWTATWPTTVTDDLTAEDASIGGGVTHTVNFRRAFAQAETDSGTLKHAVAKVTAPNVVTIYGYLADGTADDLAGVTINVAVF
jgi:hypothetical protein